MPKSTAYRIYRDPRTRIGGARGGGGTVSKGFRAQAAGFSWVAGFRIQGFTKEGAHVEGVW